jgi:hypothetical protein
VGGREKLEEGFKVSEVQGFKEKAFARAEAFSISCESFGSGDPSLRLKNEFARDDK